MADMILHVLNAIAAIVGLTVIAFFMIRYHALTAGAWRRHAWGRHVMLFSASLAVLTAQAVVFRLLGDWPGREWVLLVTRCALVAAIIQRAWLNERMGAVQVGQPTSTTPEIKNK